MTKQRRAIKAAVDIPLTVKKIINMKAVVEIAVETAVDSS